MCIVDLEGRLQLLERDFRKGARPEAKLQADKAFAPAKKEQVYQVSRFFCSSVSQYVTRCESKGQNGRK